MQPSNRTTGTTETIEAVVSVVVALAPLQASHVGLHCRHGRGHVTQRLHGMAATYPGGFKGGCNGVDHPI